MPSKHKYCFYWYIRSCDTLTHARAKWILFHIQRATFGFDYGSTYESSLQLETPGLNIKSGFIYDRFEKYCQKTAMNRNRIMLLELTIHCAHRPNATPQTLRVICLFDLLASNSFSQFYFFSVMLSSAAAVNWFPPQKVTQPTTPYGNYQAIVIYLAMCMSNAKCKKLNFAFI